MSKISAITTEFARAITQLGTDDFVPAIASILCDLAGADDATVIVYGQEELPTISFARPLAGQPESALTTYLSGPFLLDPFYRAAAYDKQFGVFDLGMYLFEFISDRFQILAGKYFFQRIINLHCVRNNAVTP